MNRMISIDLSVSVSVSPTMCNINNPLQGVEIGVKMVRCRYPHVWGTFRIFRSYQCLKSFSEYANPHLGRTWLVPLECHFSDNLRIYIGMAAKECYEKYIKTQKP